MPDLQKSQAAYKGQISTVRSKVEHIIANKSLLTEDSAVKELYTLRETLDRTEDKFSYQQKVLISRGKSEDEICQMQADLQNVRDECARLDDHLTKLIAEAKSLRSLNTSSGSEVSSDVSALIRALTKQIQEQQKQREADSQRFNAFLEAQKKEWQTIAQSSPGSSDEVEKIKIPKFSGNYLEWRSFHSVYVSVVHNNKRFTNTQKMNQLKSALSGEAALVINDLTICDENYETAWSAILKQYNNKQSMVAAHIGVFMKQQPISSPSAATIKKLQTTSSSIIKTLESLSVTEKDPWIINHMLEKLDPESRSLWAREKHADIPTWNEFEDFLISRWRELEQYTPINSKAGNQGKKGSNLNKPKSENKISSHIANDSENCPYCKKHPHKLYRCKTFLALPISKRLEVVTSLRFCPNCLSEKHNITSCTYPACRECHQKHNRLLHENNNSTNLVTLNPSVPAPGPSRSLASGAIPQVNPNEITPSTSASFNCVGEIGGNDQRVNTRVLLATAMIVVYDSKNCPHICRALLDSGSQVNLVTNRLCQDLDLKFSKTNVTIEGVGLSAQSCRHSVSLCLSPLQGNTNDVYPLDCVVMKRVTSNQPNWQVRPSDIVIPQRFKLADPQWHVTRPIDILIGAQHFWDIVGGETYSLGSGLPCLRDTKLGWIIIGSFDHNQDQANSFTVSCNVSNVTRIDEILRKFWDIESIPTETMVEREHREVENLFSATTSRAEEGRYVVHLPFNERLSDLGNNSRSAFRQFHSLESKLNKDPELKAKYAQIFEEYLKLNIIEPVPYDELYNSSFYLPHHCVVRAEAESTKVRVVFNASSRSETGVSLNDCLMIGPVVQPPLISVLMRFRMYPWALTTDIVKMYLQVLLHPPHKDYQRFLWRDNLNESVQHFRFRTVCFGVASSPHLATRVLSQLAHDEGNRFPLAAKVITSNFYVDDCLLSVKTPQEAEEVMRQLIELMNSAGMTLSKTKSNIGNFKHADDVSEVPLNDGTSNSVKTLGINWQIQSDSFCFKVKDFQESLEVITKRTMLSVIARIFDPLGIIGPVITTAKLILQEIWMLRLGWDEDVPKGLQNSWKRFMDSLLDVENLIIPRCISSLHGVSRWELHTFCDASRLAYGAVCYVVCEDSNGNRTSQLLIAKSRVTPIKSRSDPSRPLTIPKAELCGAVLGASLAQNVREAMQFDSFHFWTDAMVVLCQLHRPNAKREIFVKNRVAKVLEVSSSVQWQYVPTQENPADIISRGATPSQLLDSALWWHGPNWLIHDQDQWPNKFSLDNVGDEGTPSTLTTCLRSDAGLNMGETGYVSIHEYLMAKFSELDKAKAVLAVVKFRCVPRFRNAINSVRVTRSYPKPPTGRPTVRELRFAESIMVRWEQELFLSDLKKAVQNGAIYSSHRFKQMRKLHPFLDDDEILRVGGRLVNSPMPYNARHPMILPKGPLSEKIAIREHKLLLHAGPQLLLAGLRQKYWPLAGRCLTRKVYRNCVNCIRANPTPTNQVMGNLPLARVTTLRPFHATGIDFAGPFSLKIEGRKGITHKCYIAVFVCLSTRAVHLDVVCSLSTSAFIACLQRFVSRRGIPAEIYTDNGTTFVGADRELRALFVRSELKNDLHSFLSAKEIKWNFHPPRGPHHNGLCEAAVRSCKTHFKRVLKNVSINLEEMFTILCQIEAVLNSRPLVPLSEHAGDPTFLTPGHFLIGSAPTQLPSADLKAIHLNRLDRWQFCQRLVQHFSQRWKSEYLHTLQMRQKWSEVRSNIELGEVVLFIEENMPSTHWPLGVIQKTFTGKDGRVRVVEVKTTRGVFVRPITKVVRLLPDDGTTGDGHD